ncbi:Short chain dehydrogenase atnD [Pseudocercospora fuligena]|uniref:Short chain dehydrogenase atnD n=1 Tax=Pseudocercospora fuligena TaxID=685502 RepID=A0A8H6RMP7_9PEZI|nr:Short chain dehydrogenase atnD [Pseudocercospora fuligena]
MPAPSDILQFMPGQLFQTPTLPNTSFKGKTVVITGANTGLGFECAKQLIALGVSTLVLGCRSISKGEAARDSLQASKDSKHTSVHVWQVDMADYSSVKAFSKRMASELPRLDALLVNAGISTNQYQVAEGLESTLTVNVAAAFLLALLALPQLERTGAQFRTSTHLTIVGSNVHAFAPHQQLQQPGSGQVFSTLSDKHQADMASRYFLSKLIVMLCVRELASRVPSNRVIINCPSPGWCKTQLFRQDDGGFMGRNMLKLIGRTSEVGARCLTSAIAADHDSHGQYLSECQVKNTSVFVRSPEGRHLQKPLFEELLQILENTSPGISSILNGEKRNI